MRTAAPALASPSLRVHERERWMMPEPPRRNEIPPFLHVVNVGALLLMGLLLLLTAVVRASQLVVLAPVLILLGVYGRFRAHPRVAAGYFGLALGLLGWILLCEHIVTVDNVFGTLISQRLNLGLRLQAYVARTLRTPDRLYLEPCCDDPLTWHYRPGSLYRKRFDCPTRWTQACGEPYETVVDETGYLNRPAGLWHSHERIDLFLVGDSVLQGFGVPSVVEWLRPQLPLRLWNLSVAGYSARQKVNALLTYALPKQPTWLVLEFYAGNDLKEEITNEACDALGDFRCRYYWPELRRRLSRHPLYHTIFEEVRLGVFARFEEAAAENLTLATTRYLIDTMKAMIKAHLRAEDDRAAATPEAVHAFYNTGIIAPPGGFFAVRAGQWHVYLHTAMRVTEHHYARLAAALEGMAPKPTVILLYNPAPYEVYRGMWTDPIPQADEVSVFQRDALSAFAHAHGWRFLDLTEPLRQAVQARQVWLFGRNDKSHWSPEGTAVVAEVLGRALRPVLGPGEASRATR
jgi:hypothetical protein